MPCLMQTWVPIMKTQDAGGRTVFFTEHYDPPVPGAKQVFAVWPDINSDNWKGHRVKINWEVPTGYEPEWLGGDARPPVGTPVMESRSVWGRRRSRPAGT